ncbi:MAG: PEP-CTERM sorting domain-containing protein [Pyrinomonadaceae bacterium]|nr:PEP-CTERM sorting domain-containing protein [Pyrinomonadaceae bacterium]
MKTIKRFVPLALVLTMWLLPVSVHADPIAITGGTLTYSRTGGTPFLLTGVGLALNGSTSSLNPSVSLLANGLVAPGQIRLTGGSVDSQDSELGVSNPVTVGGVGYSPGASLLALNISSASFTAPIEGASGFVVVAPFMLTAGIVEGYENIVGSGAPLFSSLLAGDGTTTFMFLRTPAGQYQLFTQTFNFGHTVTGVTVNTIPEPATLFLLGTGLAGLLGTTKKKFRKKDPR